MRRPAERKHFQNQPGFGRTLPGADPGHVRRVAAHTRAAGGRLQTGGGGVRVQLRQGEVAQALVPPRSGRAGLGVAGLALLLRPFRGSDAGAGEGGSVGLLEIRKYQTQKITFLSMLHHAVSIRDTRYSCEVLIFLKYFRHQEYSKR